MPPATPPPRLSRRAALGTLGAAVGAVLAACTAEDEGVRRRTGRPGEPDVPEPTAPEVDPDVAVAAAALAQQNDLSHLVGAVRDRHARLAPRLDPLLATHQAHARLLAEAVPADTGTEPSPGGHAGRRTPARSRRRALREVEAAERSLVVAMKRHAFQAESGAFARVLGSMAAAAAQHAATLQAAESRGRRR